MVVKANIGERALLQRYEWVPHVWLRCIREDEWARRKCIGGDVWCDNQSKGRLHYSALHIATIALPFPPLNSLAMLLRTVDVLKKF